MSPWGRRALVLAASAAGALAVLVLLRWPAAATVPEQPFPEAAVAAASQAVPASAPLRMSPRAPGPPLSPIGEAERRQAAAQWRSRLERAQTALDNYLQAARYPHDSRPIDEHRDQVRPFLPIAEDRALRQPGGTAAQGMHLRTTQERIFVSGDDSARITLTLEDDAGRTLPLRITRAVLHEVTTPGATASTPEFAVPVNDAGSAGDLQAGDGIHTAWLHPARQGYGNYAGVLRLDLNLDYAGQPGFIYFDIVYSPEIAATWLPGVRDVVAEGSLAFILKADVQLAGRYVVSGRIDDSQGQPLAVALFNGELARGIREIRLPVFGRLLRDKQAAFPLRLRDVEAFLLKPDAHPDRVMLPRLAGVVHSSKNHPLASFSEATWSSEERERYLAELGKDVDEAKQQLQKLGP